jgi:hypothetical protein
MTNSAYEIPNSVPVQPDWNDANYYSYPPSTTVTTGTILPDTVWYIPFFVPTTKSFNRIGTEVTTASGSGGSVARLGIYAESGGVPTGAPILDAGTVATDSTGEKEITISQSLEAGWYFLAIFCDVSYTGRTNQMGASVPNLYNLGCTSPSVGAARRFYQSLSYTTLPTGGTIVAEAGNINPQRIWLRNA